MSSLDAVGQANENVVPLTPEIVHRIMLSQPNEFSSLTIDGNPRSETLYFQKFLKQEGFTSANDTGEEEEDESQQPVSITFHIAQTMKKAFHDNILEQISSSQNYATLCPLILETHQQLRSLIPNRKDLHSTLNDEWVEHVCLSVDADVPTNDDSTTEKNKLFDQTLQLLNDIAKALVMLESEDRSESTREWINIASELKKKTGNSDSTYQYAETNLVDQVLELPAHLIMWDNPQPTHKEWMLASTSFLHRKAEQAFIDIKNFQLSHVVAPRIHANHMGRDFLRKEFEIHFGRNGDDRDVDNGNSMSLSTPHLDAWLKEVVQTCGLESEILQTSREKRAEAILKTGWVDNILFRSPRQMGMEDDGLSTEQSNFMMPEIFYLDIAQVSSIRISAKVSVVGSALALHASTIAGVGNTLLQLDPLGRDVQSCRNKLILAMNNTHVGSQELFEKGVGDAVLELAKVLNPELPETCEEQIRNRCQATMRGTDPVIMLLDNRMRDIFREMIAFHPQQQMAPSTIRTGIAGGTQRFALRSNDEDGSSSFRSLLKKEAKGKFMKRGFSFYAEKLADTVVVARGIANLALYVHGTVVDEALANAC